MPRFASLIGSEETRRKPKRRKTKYFCINYANRSTKDATSKHAAQTETKSKQLRNRRNIKNTQLQSRRRTRRRCISVN